MFKVMVDLDDSDWHKFNVYDVNWNYIDTFWSRYDYGLVNSGDYIIVRDMTRYNGTVFYKRMGL
jgi:hypothetical protein